MTAEASTNDDYENDDNNNHHRKRQVNATELLSKIRADFELPETADVMELMDGQRLVAIGDIHGNLQHLKNCLYAGGIIESCCSKSKSSCCANDGANDTNNNNGTSAINPTWCAGNTILVQVGDLLDRGRHELQCLRLLCKLAREAKQAGGAVILLWGNHEVDNATGDFDCTEDFESFEKEFGPALDCCIDEDWKVLYRQRDKKRCFCPRQGHFTKKILKDPARLAVLGPGGLLAEPLLSRFKVGVCVGKTVLVHGGLTPNELDLSSSCDGNGRQSLSEMNCKMRNWILRPTEMKKNSTLDRGDLAWNDLCGASVFVDTFWNRTFSAPANQVPNNADETRGTLEAVLKSLNCDRMIVGHTIQDEINSVFDMQLWRVDTGSALISSDVPSEVLEVVAGTSHDDENGGEGGNACSCAYGEKVCVSKRVADDDGNITVLRCDGYDREVPGKHTGRAK